MPASPQKMCGSSEGFSTFSRHFKGNKNVTLDNISKNKKVIKNRWLGFLLLFIQTS